METLWPAGPAFVQEVHVGAVATISAEVIRANQPLRDAARIAFETIQDSASEAMISGLNPTAEERISYFIADMAGQDIRYYGKKPPSTVSMEIPRDERLRLSPVLGENSLVASYQHAPTYVDVAVNGDDFRRYLDHLKFRYP